MAESHIPEGLVKLTQAINESTELKSWFVGLKAATFSDRITAFNSMAKRRREDQHDEDIVRALSSLAHPEIYRAVFKSVTQENG